MGDGTMQSDRTEQPTLARDKIHASVKKHILSGHLSPGAAVSENELAAEHGVSRTPAREAIRQLALEGFVEVIPKRGTFVKTLPSSSDVRQLYEFREAVAGMSARLAAQWADESDVRRLRDLLDAMERAVDPGQKGNLADEFIRSIDRISRNLFLLDANKALLDRIHLLRRNVMHHRTTYFDGVLQLRRDLVNALANHDQDRAEERAREIVRRVRVEALRILEES